MTRYSTIRQEPSALCAPANGVTVLMTVERESYCTLDDIGSQIWALIEQPTYVGALCQTLAAAYNVSPTTVEADVLAFLDVLIQHGLIVVGG